MKLKSAVKYRFFKTAKITGIFYALMFELLIGAFIIRGVTRTNTGIEDFFPFIMYIFTFVLGLNAYSKELDMFLQNGITRQCSHYSFIALLPINLVYGLISTLTDYLFFRVDTASDPKTEFFSSHCLGAGFKMPDSMISQIFLYTVMVAFIYTLSMAFGYMIGSLSRSMKLFYKVLFGTVLVAVFIFFVTLWQLYNPDWFETIAIILRTFFLGVGTSPFGRTTNFIIATLVLSTVNLSVAHLLIRKSTIKKGADKK